MGRKIGIDIAAEVPWGSHFAFFYQTQGELIELAAPFFKAGLENHEFCLWVTYEVKLAAAEQALRNLIPDLEDYQKDKQIEIIPYTDFHLKDGHFDLQEALNRFMAKTDQAMARGYDGLRGLANLSWAGTDELDQIKEFEEKLDETICKSHMLVICAYSQQARAVQVINALTSHQLGIMPVGNGYEIIETSKVGINEETLGKEIVTRRKLEQQLYFLQKMEAIGRLAGGVAHDFNNILSIITGEAEIIKLRLQKEDPIYTDLNNILEAVDKGTALARQLMLLSRDRPSEAKIIDLNDIIGGLEEMLQRLIGEDIELAVISAPNLKGVKADPSQIEQVIINLAINARDAMPEGGKLTIEVANRLFTEPHPCHFGMIPAGRYVMLAVADTGAGMGPEVKAHLFEPFFTTKESGQGTGLGLPIVFGIVRKNGGFLEVESEPKKGATFKIFLPQVERAGELAAAETGFLGQATLKGSETILEVEDSDALRPVISTFLRHYGYQVLEAREAGEALLIGERHPEPIHLLLTDVVMPRMDGRELADRLKALHPEMKVLYMSGYTDSAVLRHGVAEKSMPFIRKPFKPVDLINEVRKILDAPRED